MIPFWGPTQKQVKAMQEAERQIRLAREQQASASLDVEDVTESGHLRFGKNFIDLSQVAVAMPSFGGGKALLRSGTSITMNAAEFSVLLDGLKSWARRGAPRPDPGTDTTDNGLQGT